jgi:hypothetical protein
MDRQIYFGEQMKEIGFELYHTGGGCEAWAYWNPDGTYIFVTCEDDPSVPPDEKYPVAVGYYNAEDNCFRDETYPSLPAAYEALRPANLADHQALIGLGFYIDSDSGTINYKKRFEDGQFLLVSDFTGRLCQFNQSGVLLGLYASNGTCISLGVFANLQAAHPHIAFHPAKEQA